MIKDDDQGTPSILSRNTSLLEGLKRGEGQVSQMYTDHDRGRGGVALRSPQGGQDRTIAAPPRFLCGLPSAADTQMRPSWSSSITQSMGLLSWPLLPTPTPPATR
jgi:hypothetical protein